MFRNKKITLAVAFLIAAVFCIPFYRSELFTGLDLTFHLSRIDGLLYATRDLQFPVAIYPDKNFGFGYASPLFYCDLFLYPAAVLYALNIPLLIVYKIYVFIIAWIGAYTALIAMHTFTRSQLLCLFGAVIFTFSSYHINDFFIRAALGEAMAFSLMPLFPVVAYHFFVEKNDNMMELAVFFSALALCHLITFTLCAAVFAVLILCYLPTFSRKMHWFTFLKAVGIGFCLCAFFLLPMLQQLRSQKFLFVQNRELFGEEIMKLYSNTPLSAASDYAVEMGYDLESHHYYTGIVMVLTPILFLFSRQHGKKHAFFAILTAISVLLLSCTTNLVPLHRISVLQSIQFTYRFNIIIASLLPFVLVYTLDHFDRQLRPILAVVLLSYTALNTSIIYRQLHKYRQQTDNFATPEELFSGPFYENYNNYYNVAELSSGEYLPATHHMNYEENQGSVFLFETVAPSVTYTRSGTTSILQMDSATGGFASIPVTWYLGYEAVRETESGDVVLPITQEEYTGQIVIPIEAGEHTYRISYIGTRVQKYALLLSFITLLAVITWMLIQKARSSETAGE